MGEFSVNPPVCAIVVGRLDDEFVRSVVSLLAGCGVRYVACENVYSAVGWLAKRGHNGKGLVIGRFEELSREHERFFHIACEKGYTCGCLTDEGTARKRQSVVTVTETGAFIVSEPAEIGKVVTRFVGDIGGLESKEKVNNGESGFIKDEFLPTKAELDALLGV